MRINGIDVGWPICAMCNKPIDSIETERDMLTGGIRIRAHHHGAVDEVLLPESVILMGEAATFKFTTAFATKVLPA